MPGLNEILNKAFGRKKESRPYPFQNDMHQHFLLVERDCPHCRLYLGVVQRINAKLPPDKRIIVLDTTEFQTEGIGVAFDPVVEEIKWEDTPHLYLDGTVIVGMTTPVYAEWYLNGRLKNEFV